MTRIDEIRERLDKATPGPWSWRNTSPTNVLLLGAQSRAVMTFRRNGMQAAQPQFRGEDGTLLDTARANINAFPDAALIANAPSDIRWLLDTVARRDARCADLAVQLDAIRAVLDEQPDPCPEHPDDDPVTCGWKRDIIAIRNILNDTKEN